LLSDKKHIEPCFIFESRSHLYLNSKSFDSLVMMSWPKFAIYFDK